MGRVAIVVALALQACGPRSPGPEQPDASSASGRDGERERDGKSERDADAANSDSVGSGQAADCPARFDVSMQDSTCAEGSHCVYPEAECWCAAKQVCSGVDPGPDVQVWFEWSCSVSDPAVRRRDGCPAKVPEHGQACDEDGKLCHYSPYCGGIQSTGRCTNKAWQLEQIEVSAPPSSDG